ncbi:MAG: GTPase [Roseiflexaceae bacterium]|nr:GTPase [Roseiflexaceae bacterium]
MAKPADQQPAPPFAGFTPAMLAAMRAPGVAERWAAVQEQLHPPLAALAEQLRAEGLRRFPRAWPLYETTFKNLRYVNRGTAPRAPIDEYHFALDRPPRGAGVYVAVSAADRAILVTFQVARSRRKDLARVWEASRASWLPLVERVNDVRFLDDRPRTENREQRTKNREQRTENREPRTENREPQNRRTAEQRTKNEEQRPETREPTTEHAAPNTDTWLDRYFSTRSSSPLLAGFAYSWDDPQIGQPGFAAQLITDVLALFQLNEAVMEQVEALEPTGAQVLRDGRATYAQGVFPPIEQIVERIRARGFALADATIRAYHVALQTKPLVILPGISGTGKTRLTRLYADAIHAANLTPGQDNPFYLIVAVQPDWHNARDLLGYYNALSGKFHTTPFLRLLQRAAADPSTPYYVCLDELNLARPEYYLAPILSALETEEHLIDLGVPGPTAETTGGELLPNPFRLPLNVHITGTVNVDESTHTLSDKLLDRANLIELTDVDLPAFRASYRGAIDPTVWQTITQLHELTAQAGQPFGYRTVGEILRYIEQAEGVLPRSQALDQQIKQKILPKLRGDDTPRLRRALAGLLELTLGQPQIRWGSAARIEPEQLSAAPFPESAEKLRRMLERLERDGFTDFYS